MYLYDICDGDVALAQDGLEDDEIACGVKNCVHSIFIYNAWRDRCLPAPAHDALIHEVRMKIIPSATPPPKRTIHMGVDTPVHCRHAQLWEECHRRIKRTLRADSDLFAQMERELGPFTEVKGTLPEQAMPRTLHTVAAAKCDSPVRANRSGKC